MHKSVSTIENPEFINLQPSDISPLISSCEIKVLYTNENRNGSYISKEVATEMAKTLRGSPIVGYFREEKDDFGDHGEKIVIENGEVKISCNTVPYGFVSPDAKVWFKTFEENDEFGNVIQREYLMTTGFLWTEQFEEAKRVVEEGRPQSMELDEESLKGHWAKNSINNMEFFIINDATFSKLCILGEDVEPCFEGASVTSPEVSSTFTKNEKDFKKTLFSMMQTLKEALEGGQQVKDEKEKVENTFTNKADSANQSLRGKRKYAGIMEEASLLETETSFANKEDTKEEEKLEDTKAEEDKEKTEEEYTCNEDDKKKYELLQKEYNELNDKFNKIQEEYESLKNFKLNVENKEKDEMISKFYMLDEEDKKDVILNKANYTIDEIEAKLSVIYTKKNFAAEKEKVPNPAKTEEVVTYTINETTNDLPDWVKAVCETAEEN
jgi:hypothetical protein